MLKLEAKGGLWVMLFNKIVVYIILACICKNYLINTHSNEAC